MMFTFDTDAARAHLESLDPEDLPTIWLESPAGSLEDIFDGDPYRLREFLTEPEGHSLIIEPIICENDSDRMMIGVAFPGDAPMACQTDDWDDFVPGPRDSYLGETIDVDQVLGFVAIVIETANDLATRARQAGVPLVIVVRDPDAANTYRVFGGEVETHDIDLGYFDVSHPGEFADWAQSHLAYAAENERARPDVAEYVLGIVEQTRARYGHPTPTLEDT